MHKELYRNYDLFNCLNSLNFIPGFIQEDHQNSANLDFIRLFIHGITFIKLGFGKRLNDMHYKTVMEDLFIVGMPLRLQIQIISGSR